MSRRSRVDRERPCVPDIGHMTEQLQGIDELLSCGRRIFRLDPKDYHGPALALEVFLGLFVLGIGREAGVADPCDLIMRLEMFGYLLSVLAVPLHAETEGFDSLNDRPAVVWTDACAEVAEGDCEGAEFVCQGCQCLGQVVAPSLFGRDEKMGWDGMGMGL